MTNKSIRKKAVTIAIVIIALMLMTIASINPTKTAQAAFYPNIFSNFGTASFSANFYTTKGSSTTDDITNSKALITSGRFSITPTLSGSSENSNVGVTVKVASAESAKNLSTEGSIPKTRTNRTKVGSGFVEFGVFYKLPIHPYSLTLVAVTSFDIDLTSNGNQHGTSLTNFSMPNHLECYVAVWVYGCVREKATVDRTFRAEYMYTLTDLTPKPNNFKIPTSSTTDGDYNYYNQDVTLEFEQGVNIARPEISLETQIDNVTERKTVDVGSATSLVITPKTVSDKAGDEIAFTLQAKGSGDNLNRKIVIDKVAPRVTFDRAGSEPIIGPSQTLNITIEDPFFRSVKINGAEETPTIDGSGNRKITVQGSSYAEGTVTCVTEDKAGNAKNFAFRVDKTAPSANLVGVTNGGITKESVRLRWDEVGCNATLNGVAYSTNTAIDLDGNYTFVLIDSCGNSVTYTFGIDKTAPTVVALPRYTNKSFTFQASDARGIQKIIYYFNGVRYETSSDRVVASTPGEWRFQAIDIVDNASATTTVGYAVRNNFGNADRLINEYKVTSYYRVNLPSKIYTDCYGAYSFRTQDAALRFAIAKEWEYRVEILSGGRWSYINIGNSSVTMIYTDRAELDKAVIKYASAYVSDRIIMGTSGSTYERPTDDSLVTRADALTENAPKLPSHLQSYSTLRLSYVRNNFVWNRPSVLVEGNTSTLKLKYVSNGLIAQNGAEWTLGYTDTLKTQLETVGGYKQGYYLVTESDLCGNVQQYLLCLDIGAPSANVTVVQGNGVQKALTFDEAYIETNKNVLLFLSLSLDSIEDQLDKFSCIYITGRSLDQYFTAGDLIPTLCYESNYYGKYTVTLYDRSYNKLSFDVKIAGAAPVVTHSSLTSETRLRLTIEVSDSTNALTEVKLYKVAFDGTSTELPTDDNGTVISAENLVYTLNTGGKYFLRLVDVYGRVIETDPLFYMKGLPSGTLSGCKDRGATNKDVALKFSETCNVILYRFDGTWQEVTQNSDYSVTQSQDMITAKIQASESTSARYKFFLYVADDMNLFTEYYFEIDCVMPVISAQTSSTTLDNDSITKDDFSVVWTESNITVMWYSSKTVMGEVGATRYTKGTIINKSAVHYFIARDAVGNESRLTITLDNVVNYTITGSYQEMDGAYVSKSFLMLTVNERTKTFQCVSTNGLTLANGQRIEEDGTYVFTVEDTAGNIVELTLIIDKLPPVLVFNQADGEVVTSDRTRAAFSVFCAEANVVIKISRDKKLYTLYDGSILDDAGMYYFVATDRMGNTLETHMLIDRKVDFIVGGNVYLVGDTYKTNTWFALTVTEVTTAFDVSSSHGSTFGMGDRVSEEGNYTVIIRDTCDNEVTLHIIIDKSAPIVRILLNNGAELAVNGSTNQAFRVVSEEICELSFRTQKNASYITYDGQTLTESVIYYFRAIDDLGNALDFSVTIDSEVKYVIKGSIKQKDAYTFVTNNWLSVSVSESIDNFIVTANNGINFALGETVTIEGVYNVQITDQNGNSVILTLIVDKTPPAVTIAKKDGTSIGIGSATNQPFSVATDENDAIMTYSAVRNSQFVSYNGEELSEARTYYFKVIDFAGNESAFSVAFDNKVDFKVLGGATQVDETTYASKTYISVVANEPMTYSSEYAFSFDVQFREEADFFVTLIDAVGNTVVIRIIIDKIIPIITLSGVLANGTTGSTVVVTADGYVGLYIVGDNGKVLSEIDSGAELTAHGRYTVRAVDIAGNATTVSFVIDKQVDIEFTTAGKTLLSGQFVTGSISLVFNEDVACSLTHNGVETKELRGLKTPGRYLAVATDVYGNRIELSCTLISVRAQEYELDFMDGDEVSYSIDGKTYQVANSVSLSEEGTYSISVRRNATAYELMLTVDRQPPTLDIEHNRGSFVLKNISKKNATMKLYRNGEEVAALLNKAFTETGNYTLIVTDDCGNATEYVFVLKYVNTAGILVSVIGGLLILGAIAGGLMYRKRLKVK